MTGTQSNKYIIQYTPNFRTAYCLTPRAWKNKITCVQDSILHELKKI